MIIIKKLKENKMNIVFKILGCGEIKCVLSFKMEGIGIMKFFVLFNLLCVIFLSLV